MHSHGGPWEREPRGIDDDEEVEDWQDKILKAMEGRKMLGNASYFAFTATPKNATLEKFGQQDAEGKFHPFHLYSMKQAIEEGFLPDVPANYTTYKSYYEIQKSIVDNPLFDSFTAQQKLKAYVEAHPDTIEVKAKIMMDHFIANIWQAKKLKYQTYLQSLEYGKRAELFNETSFCLDGSLQIKVIIQTQKLDQSM